MPCFWPLAVTTSLGYYPPPHVLFPSIFILRVSPGLQNADLRALVLQKEEVSEPPDQGTRDPYLSYPLVSHPATSLDSDMALKL